MKKPFTVRRHWSGSILVAAMLSLTVLAVIMGTLLTSLVQRHNLTYQTAAWQESRMAAEAGIDLAMNNLNRSPAEVLEKNNLWWRWRSSTETSIFNRVSVLQYSEATLNNGLSSGAALRASPDRLFLDNHVLPIASDAGRNAVVDVEIRSLFPDPDRTDEVWFRIRSLGTAGIQGFRKWAAPYAEDARLRTVNLERFNYASGSSGPDFGRPQTDAVSTPNASRVIEVIAKPVRAFSVAILTDGLMDLGNSNNYRIDSYDSRDGAYMEDTSKDNGDIASNGKKASSDNFEILANKTTIKGDVFTNDVGIDGQPRFYTSREERISGEVQAGFQMDLIKTKVPKISSFAPGDLTSITPGNYTVNGDLGAFEVPTAGEVIIHVKGDWSTGNGAKSTVVLAEGASVEIYVEGEIDFGNGDINMLPDGSVGVPSNMMIYGVGNHGGDIKMSGNPIVSAAIYAPKYDVVYKGGGNGAFFGAVVANGWSMSGGGNAGFHYDEALAERGVILGFQIHSYIEDWRRMAVPTKS